MFFGPSQYGNAFNISTGAGYDQVNVQSSADFNFDGGDGIDTLVLKNGVDLSSNNINLNSVERIGLSDTGSVKLNASTLSGQN